MISGNQQVLVTTVALGIALLVASAAHGETGVNCAVGGVHFSLPTSGANTPGLGAASSQVQIQCTSVQAPPSRPPQVAQSTYPVNRRTGQVTWSTDHNDHANHARQQISVVHRSDTVFNSSSAPTAR